MKCRLNKKKPELGERVHIKHLKPFELWRLFGRAIKEPLNFDMKYKKLEEI